MKKFIPPVGAVKLSVQGKIADKFYRAHCWAMPKKRTDFPLNCDHKTIYEVIIASLPPALKKAATKRKALHGGGLYVCRCTAKLVKP